MSVTTFRPATKELVSHSFNFGDAPQTIWTMPVGGRVVDASVAIRTPFNAAGATIKLGTAADDDGIVGTGDNVPTVAGEYGVTPDFDLSQSTAIRLTVTPDGASAGAGVVTLTIAYN